jgi:hypothetical protein
VHHERIYVSTQRGHTRTGTTTLHGTTQGHLCLYSPQRMCAKFNSDICAVVQPILPALAQQPQHLHARCNSRRFMLVVPIANVCEVFCFHTDACAIVRADLPAIVASRFPATNDTQSACRGGARRCRVPPGEHRMQGANK